MPTYGYECLACKEQFEVVQKITDDALKVHEGCGGELRKLMYPVGIVFKGSGFYVNDYGKKGNGSATSSATTSAAPESKNEAKTETPAAPAPAAKTEAKAETKPAAPVAAAK